MNTDISLFIAGTHGEDLNRLANAFLLERYQGEIDEALRRRIKSKVEVTPFAVLDSIFMPNTFVDELKKL